jgi:hypothetical protein
MEGMEGLFTLQLWVCTTIFLETSMAANDTQIGGSHYKKGGEEHWDRAWRLQYDSFQYIITKWVERWKEKGGVEDLKKAAHAIQKYIEVVEQSPPPRPMPKALILHFGAVALAVSAEDVVATLGKVAASGWIGYTFEGEDQDGRLYTCKNCRESFRVPTLIPPMAGHICDGEEATSAYTNQD